MCSIRALSPRGERSTGGVPRLDGEGGVGGPAQPQHGGGHLAQPIRRRPERPGVRLRENRAHPGKAALQAGAAVDRHGEGEAGGRIPAPGRPRPRPRRCRQGRSARRPPADPPAGDCAPGSSATRRGTSIAVPAARPCAPCCRCPGRAARSSRAAAPASSRRRFRAGDRRRPAADSPYGRRRWPHSPGGSIHRPIAGRPRPRPP